MTVRSSAVGPRRDEHVYRNGWLERFLSPLEEAWKWMAGGDHARRVPPAVSSARPDLPPHRVVRGDDELVGGLYRNFLVRYPEANRLHKRMLLTSRLVRSGLPARSAAAPATPPVYGPEPGGGGTRRVHRGRLRPLLRAQCNDAYWHGVFGGLYLPHLRHAAYSALLSRTTPSRIGPTRDGGPGFRP